jgi:xanthine/CO dehydrogenase XdhC/CoxF family maturation factor
MKASSVATKLIWTDVSTRRGGLFIDVVAPSPRSSLVARSRYRAHARPMLDDAALIAALRSTAPFVGPMRRRRAQSARLERLLDAGLSAQELDRLAAPVGLDLGASSSQQTALSSLAGAVAVRHGQRGGRLRARNELIRTAIP